MVNGKVACKTIQSLMGAFSLPMTYYLCQIWGHIVFVMNSWWLWFLSLTINYAKKHKKMLTGLTKDFKPCSINWAIHCNDCNIFLDTLIKLKCLCNLIPISLSAFSHQCSQDYPSNMTSKRVYEIICCPSCRAEFDLKYI